MNGNDITRKGFIGGLGAFVLSNAFSDTASASPAWLEKAIDEALKRYTAWKGADETVVFPITTDLHAWYPDLDESLGAGKDHKLHIPYALRVGERFAADFHADLGDIGSDLVSLPKFGGATAEEQKRRYVSQFELYDKTTRPVFHCVGNHDLSYVTKDADGKTKHQSVEPSVFGEHFAPLAHGAEVVWGEGKHYGYWDVPGKNFRVIVLDTFEWRHSYGLKVPQLQFLAKALSVPPETTVIALMHAELQPQFACWLGAKGVMGYRNHCNGAYAKFGYKEAIRMFEDFVAHGKGESGEVKWDFTGLKGNRLAALLSGHSHYNNSMKAFDVPYICRQGHGWLSLKTELPHENGATYAWFAREKDTLIDVVAVKPKTGELRIFRVGADNEKGDFT